MIINNFYKTEIEKNFRLPINYVPEKYEIQDNIKTDLELYDKNNLYNYVCNPSTKIAEFTTDAPISVNSWVPLPDRTIPFKVSEI